MEYRKIKSNGDELSLLGFGTLRLPIKFGKVNLEASEKLILDAISRGINYIDTGYLYCNGQCEEILGKIIDENELRSKVRICTKLPHWMCENYSDFDKFFSSQLSRLRIDTIDYYLIHALDGPSWASLKEMGIMEFLDGLKNTGKVQSLGFSFHGKADDFRIILDEYDWDVCQFQYNFLDEDNQAGTEGLNYAFGKNIGVIIMEPLRGGLLARSIPGKVRMEYNRSGIDQAPVSWALRWVMGNPKVTCVLSGMNTHEQISENISIVDSLITNPYSQQERDVIDGVKDIYHRLLKVPCTGCGYCIPCPYNVNIPLCFEIYNMKYLDLRETKDNAFNDWYAFRCGSSDQPGLASQCVACGNCEKRCPQGIDIIESLVSVKNEFEGKLFSKNIQMKKFFMKKLKDRDFSREKRN